MRITREEAERNRARIVEAAAKLFRENGFERVGVAELMREAGMTHGGFYNHFQSKEELEAAASTLAFERAIAGLAETQAGASAAERRAAFARYVDHYLSAKARDASAARCPMVALTVDATRQGPAVRQAFAEGVASYVDALAAGAKGAGGGKERARARAIEALALMVGGLLLARGVTDADRPLSDEILATARKAAARAR